jgi:hypothetical protein
MKFCIFCGKMKFFLDPKIGKERKTPAFANWERILHKRANSTT